MENLAFRLLPVPWMRRRWAAAGAAAPREGGRRLLVDLSLISRHDEGTGVQRVVRNLHRELEEAPPQGYRVLPVAATRATAYRYLDALGQPAAPADARAGDLFLGLDLAPQVVSRRAAQLAAWKRSGARLVFLVHDLLPVRHPEWFREITHREFRRWLRTVAILADRVVCVSGTVQADFRDWTRSRYDLDSDGIASAVIPLGADPYGFVPEEGAGATGARLPDACLEAKFVLMVGTIEPRKGHAEVIDAFEPLWAAGEATQLVIAGRAGWMVEPLIARLRAHPLAGRRLHWLDGPSDAHLTQLYRRASGLVMASKGEGLGLPILEARRWGKPVLARDIPVFREIAGAGMAFFANDARGGLSGALAPWIAHLSPARCDLPDGPAVSWRQSRDHLVQALVAPQ